MITVVIAGGNGMDSYELFTIQIFIIVFGLVIGWILSGPHLAKRSSLSPYDRPIKFKKEKENNPLRITEKTKEKEE